MNVGSIHSQSSIECDNPEVITVTLPDLPQANPVRDRRSSVISVSSSPTGIEAGHNKMVADAVVDGINRARRMENDNKRRASRRYNEYSRPIACEQKSFPQFIQPQSW